MDRGLALDQIAQRRRVLTITLKKKLTFKSCMERLNTRSPFTTPPPAVSPTVACLDTYLSTCRLRRAEPAPADGPHPSAGAPRHLGRKGVGRGGGWSSPNTDATACVHQQTCKQRKTGAACRYQRRLTSGRPRRLTKNQT